MKTWRIRMSWQLTNPCGFFILKVEKMDIEHEGPNRTGEMRSVPQVWYQCTSVPQRCPLEENTITITVAQVTVKQKLSYRLGRAASASSKVRHSDKQSHFGSSISTLYLYELFKLPRAFCRQSVSFGSCCFSALTSEKNNDLSTFRKSLTTY